MKVLIADFDYGDVDIEHRILEDAGLEVVETQCRTEEEVVEAARGVSALLTQYSNACPRAATWSTPPAAARW